MQGVIHESAKNISKVVKRTNRIYTNAIAGLANARIITYLKRVKIKLLNYLMKLMI